jgi:hypothetical protein
MGMGGLHSQESKENHTEGGGYILADWDVASYYPAIILNCGLYPKQMGIAFLEVYRNIVNDRLSAKANGDKVKSEALKITINGAFGKLGSKYSSMYAPELMVQVTVTGQLSLLMLIASLELKGIPIVSANTDGIVIKCPVNKESTMIEVINKWEIVTGFDMERNDYSALYSRDVNNYIAIKSNGTVKTKGCFTPPDLKKNPSNEICNNAVIKYLTAGVPLIETIESCKDFTKFITARQVNGGAIKDGKFLGKSVRWYYSKKTRTAITYKDKGDQVPKSIGANPVMDLPTEFPKDIDYGWYLKESQELLKNIGINITGQMDLL